MSVRGVSALPERPITILVAALGGEGGGVLADWIVAAATSQDYPVQSTSIPGVAQRTGATTYYIEIYPAKTADLGGRRPVMTLTPAPGYVDIMIASELLEAARAMQNGYVSERTTLIASTHRIYTVAEKMQMGDGRFDGGRIVEAARAMAKRAVLFDMQAQADAAGTVISAVMFGALAGSGELPLSWSDCEAVILAGGKGARASLKGFQLGHDRARGEAGAPAAGEARRRPAATLQRVRRVFPEPTHAILDEGVARTLDFQDERYANIYLDRLELVLDAERDQSGGASAWAITGETARFLALWMCYEDVIRVADLKSRASRFERVRAEVRAKPGEPVHVTEFLKPGVEELAAILPPRAARALRGWAERRGLADRLNVGLRVKTTSVAGFLLLRVLAWLKPLRPRTSRWREEQQLIDRWVRAVIAATRRDMALALEIALCGRLIKGYGETHRRGKGNFLRILETLVEGGAFADERTRAQAIRSARESALADPEGRALDGALAAHGIAPRPPEAKPVRFMERPRTDGRKAA
jgi:indolepyruvate ferredoxin oxidoreductase, beta subunit